MKRPLAPLLPLALLCLSPVAAAQFDAYAWDFVDGQVGGGQSFVVGDSLSVLLNPSCGFGDFDIGWAETLFPEAGRVQFSYSGTSLACAGFGGYCEAPSMFVLAGPSSCATPIAPPGCTNLEAVFNGGQGFFVNDGVQSESGTWTVDLEVGDLLRIGAIVPGSSLDCQVLAGFGNLTLTPRFASSVASLSLSSGGSADFTLTAPQSLAGSVYWILGSVSGSAPGIRLGAEVLPLNPDAYLDLTLASPGAPPLANSLGSLDATAVGTATFTLPPNAPAALAGATVHHAGVVVDFGQGLVELVTDAAPLAFTP